MHLSALSRTPSPARPDQRDPAHTPQPTRPSPLVVTRIFDVDTSKMMYVQQFSYVWRGQGHINAWKHPTPPQGSGPHSRTTLEYEYLNTHKTRTATTNKPRQTHNQGVQAHGSNSTTETTHQRVETTGGRHMHSSHTQHHRVRRLERGRLTIA